jgi:dihydroorotate dehydrogenase (fumarate)
MDLRTRYLGLDLEHPIVASASPLSRSLDGVRRLEDAGAAAIVLFSLFEEQIRHEQEALVHLTQAGTESFAESLSYFPAAHEYRVGPDEYLELIRRARAAVGVPIIASLNGMSSEGWTSYARLMQEAGASALELNVYYVPASLTTTGREVEERTESVVRLVRASVDLPLAVKVGPFYSAFGEMAQRLVTAGADGLVLFNRFYQPDFDLDKLEVRPSLDLSWSAELRIPLLWVAVLHGRIEASLAATSGVETPRDVVKYLLAGADVVMSASSLLRHGPGRLGELRHGLADWMERRSYSSVSELRGAMSQKNVGDPAAFERANYVRVLQSYRNPYLP